MAGMRKLLVIVKRSAYDMYVGQHGSTHLKSLLHKKDPSVRNMVERHVAHERTLQVCKDLLAGRGLEVAVRRREELQEFISGVDLVLTVGGDGTLLEASHHLDHTVPVLGVNSDPTDELEVESSLLEFDATRSTGHLCAATAATLPQVMEWVLGGAALPAEVARIRTVVDGASRLPPALNDVLLAHPDPAAVSRLSFSIRASQSGAPRTPLVHSRSSGLRVCSPTGATAAMQSAGGCAMDPLSGDLQYKVREPISPHPRHAHLGHGLVGRHEVLAVRWGSRQGRLYVDGSHVSLGVTQGSAVEVSAGGPPLRLYRREDLLG